MTYISDYTNYALAWSCTDLPNDRSREEVGIMGRKRNLSETVYRKVDALLAEIDLNRADFRFILHDEET